MNNKQWYATSALFLIFTFIATYFQMLYTSLVAASNADFMFVTARMYDILQIVFILGCLICFACGYLEGKK